MKKNKVQISRIRTVPYSRDELGQIGWDEAIKVHLYGREKALGEDNIESFYFENLADLRNRVIDSCHKYDAPVIVKMGNRERESFIPNKQYDQRDPQGLFEIIFYSYSTDHDETQTSSFHNEKDPIAGLPEDPSTKEDFTPEWIASRREELQISIQESLRIWPIRPPVPAGRTTYVPARDVNIICRIVGKGWENVFAHKEYYQSLNRTAGPVQYIDSTIQVMSQAGEYQVAHRKIS